LCLKTTVNYNNILKLNDINKYPVYTLGKIIFPFSEKEVFIEVTFIEVTFVSNGFSVSQSGILRNNFFQQTSSKIDYAKGYLL